MKKILKNTQHGFTLIEMLIYMALLSVFLVILTDILTTTLDVQLQSQAHSAVVQDGDFVLSRLSSDIQRADGIITPATNGITSNTLQLNIGGTTYTYSANGNLLLNDSTSSDQLNSNQTQISNLSFKKIGNTGNGETIVIDFILTGTDSQNVPESETFHTAIQRGL